MQPQERVSQFYNNKDFLMYFQDANSKMKMNRLSGEFQRNFPNIFKGVDETVNQRLFYWKLSCNKKTVFNYKSTAI